MQSGNEKKEDPDDSLELADLVRRAQAGERRAMEKVCRQLQNQIKCTLSRVICNSSIVEDLSQETYLRLIKNFSNIREPIKIKRYVAQIVTYVINDYFREKYKLAHISIKGQSDLCDGSITPGDDEILHEIVFQDLLNTISDPVNKHLIQLKLDGKNYKEISRELFLSEASIKMRFQRLKQKLSKKFNQKI